MKKFLTVLSLIVFIPVILFAQSNWYDGLKLKDYDISGLKHISSTVFYDIITPYYGQEFSPALYSEIESEIYKVEGIDYITADIVDNVNPAGVKLVINVHELPVISTVSFTGNNKVKSYDLTSSLTTIKNGNFFDPTKKASMEIAKNELRDVYLSKGFDDAPVELSYELNEAKNTVALQFSVKEGTQTRIISFDFEGNANIQNSALKKLISSKVKSLFNNGYYDESKLNTDAQNIMAYYMTQGYVDAQVTDIRAEELPDYSNEKYRAVSVTFCIDEGALWYYGGLSVRGNQVYSVEDISKVLKFESGSILNYEMLQNEINAVADLYYDNGYISTSINLNENRNYDTNTISFVMDIIEGNQAVIEDVTFSGLTKTKEFVMRRELAIHSGDIFSKSKLITSAQNLYNTGLLANLDYDIKYGKQEDGVIIDFKLEEGNQMDIQFGATFGGTVDGFPISGFLQWSNHNFMGKAQELDINTNISPDSQNLGFTFGDSWVKDKRWSNSISLNFSHTKYKNELQKSVGYLPFYNGRNDSETYPLGTTKEEWQKRNTNDYLYTDMLQSKDLMDYRLLSVSLGYSSGYTFVFDSGRLSLNGGLSFSLNKALFDSCYVPYEKLIYQYGQKWQFSNILTISAQWDGRDYINNPTKGYVLSTTFTYAGGILGGLSNYTKLSASAAWYHKVASFGKEEKQHNLMFSASTTASVMMKQYYTYKEADPFYSDVKDGVLGFYDPRLGATKYEMLYIDGMTIARGHDTNLDNVFLWDNMLELGYPLIENMLQAEIFTSGTALLHNYSDYNNGLDWYLAAGAGIKLKISGFPLGLYLVKNATYNNTNGFNWMSGPVFHGNNSANSGMKFVLAISTSLI